MDETDEGAVAMAMELLSRQARAYRVVTHMTPTRPALRQRPASHSRRAAELTPRDAETRFLRAAPETCSLCKQQADGDARVTLCPLLAAAFCALPAGAGDAAANHGDCCAEHVSRASPDAAVAAPQRVGAPSPAAP